MDILTEINSVISESFTGEVNRVVATMKNKFMEDVRMIAKKEGTEETNFVGEKLLHAFVTSLSDYIDLEDK